LSESDASNRGAEERNPGYAKGAAVRAARPDAGTGDTGTTNARVNGDAAAPARVAAFFDVDGTILSCQSGTLYIGYLRREGLMSRADQLRIYWGYLTYRLGMLNMRRLAGVLSRWLEGREEREVIEHCRDWYATEIVGYYQEFIIEKIREHRDAGHVVALLTGGTRYLNDHIAAELGIEHIIASKLEVIDGRFTGNPLGPLCYARGKLTHAEEFAAKHGVSLERSWFYSDSITDLPMLERVGQPVAVCPDPRLRREARQRGWPILDGRANGTRRLAGGEATVSSKP
jgi:HAD superfamily hydrolase (TIGR01490 family)